MDGLTEGRIVRYVVGRVGAEETVVDQERPAIITKVWNDAGLVNLFVLGIGPFQVLSDSRLTFGGAPGLYWATSVSFSEDPQPQTWHWPERA